MKKTFKEKAKEYLQKKININLKERKKFGWNVPQAIAISYNQTKNKYPKAKLK